jgi:hypothetical protein
VELTRFRFLPCKKRPLSYNKVPHNVYEQQTGEAEPISAAWVGGVNAAVQG